MPEIVLKVSGEIAPKNNADTVQFTLTGLSEDHA